jgi:hypothetical protein
LLQILGYAGSVVVGSIQALWVGKFFVFEKLSFEDLAVVPCSQVSEDGHNNVARANLIAPGKMNTSVSVLPTLLEWNQEEIELADLGIHTYHTMFMAVETPMQSLLAWYAGPNSLHWHIMIQATPYLQSRLTRNTFCCMNRAGKVAPPLSI